MFRVRTGSGLSYWVHPGKGMDISLAEFCGIPVNWSAANGDPHPAYFREEGNHWLQTASGGLLMTCGLSQAGAVSRDDYRLMDCMDRFIIRLHARLPIRRNGKVMNMRYACGES